MAPCSPKGDGAETAPLGPILAYTVGIELYSSQWSYTNQLQVGVIP